MVVPRKSVQAYKRRREKVKVLKVLGTDKTAWYSIVAYGGMWLGNVHKLPTFQGCK